MPEVEHNETLNYTSERKEFFGGTYQYDRISPEASPTIQLNGIVSADFELPVQPLNLSKTRLRGTFTFPAAGLATYTHIHSGTVPFINQITLGDEGSAEVVNIKNVAEYLKVILPSHTKLSEFSQTPINDCYATAVGSSYGPMFHRTDVIAGSAPAANTLSGYYVAPDGKVVEEGEVSILDINQFYTSAANTALVVQLDLPLSVFKGSLLSYPRDIFFNKKLKLSVYFDKATKYGTTSDQVGELNNANNSDPVALATPPVLTNLKLYTAIQKNPMIRQETMKHFSNISNMNIPFVVYQKRAIEATADEQTMTYKLNSGKGRRVLRVITSLNNPTENKMSAFNNNNSGGRFSKVRVKFNSQYESTYTIDIGNGEGYMLQQDDLKGSVIQSEQQWLQNFSWVSNFVGAPLHECQKTDFSESGATLHTDSEYTLELTSDNVANICYIWAIVQKQWSVNDVDMVVV